uniref:Uncharacterized protein n=1 Tax=Solanum lycopersicum TaxID=4081 RepID=K4DDQ6_SOLLC
MACHHGPCTTHTVGLRQAWQSFISLGKYTWSWNVIIMTSRMGCHHRLWTTYMVGRDRACYDIITKGKNTRSDDVACDMPSLPLDRTHSRTTSAWYVIIAVGQHIWLENTRANDVGHGRPSSLLNNIDRVECRRA